MLQDFITANRTEIITRCRSKVGARALPEPTEWELEHGVPIFLDQLAENLRRHVSSSDAMRDTAASHGGELLRLGFTVGQVVHDYGDICQSVTELALERRVPITTAEFQVLNYCLDEAIADAVTEYGHQRDHRTSREQAERLGFITHEFRNALNTAALSFEVLRRGSVGVGGSTGAVLGRSLVRLRDLLSRLLTDVRLEAGIQSPERVPVAQFLGEIEVAAAMEAQTRSMQLTVVRGSGDVAVEADRQLLDSVVANLLQNAFKFTRPGGHVSLRSSADAERVLIEVEDECGGLPEGDANALFRPFEQRGGDRTGLGLGLAICHRGIEASGGVLHVRDLPGTGCVFTVDLPRSIAAVRPDASA